MAKAPTGKKKGAASAGGGKKAGGGGVRALSLVIAIILVVLFFDSVIVLAAGMIPTGVAYLVDRRPQRYAARTVAWMNLAGCLVVVLDLWDGGGSIDRAIELLLDPVNWVIMFGSAGFGWVIYFTLPPIVSGYLALSQEMRLKDLAKKQKSLEKEWGEEVRKSAPLDRLEALEAEIAAAQSRGGPAHAATGGATGGAGAGADGGEGADRPEADAAPEPEEDLSDTPAGRPLTGRGGAG
ncbi:MAG: hypothetical protein NXI21_02830 [Alphaproteobacteria bacterium]|nr:hypothetical protein [Alphaproteobacteria bacterium]